VNLRGTWGRVPRSHVRSQAYCAPALVAFVGGSNFRPSTEVPPSAWPSANASGQRRTRRDPARRKRI